MKILFVTGDFLPSKNGGIENYVFWLAQILKEQNFLIEVAALNVREECDYFYESIHVHYLNNNISIFEELLKNGAYDICHFHEYSGKNGINVSWLTFAKQICGKVFFTFHLPYLTCYKNDFRYKGIEDCNNFTDVARCIECVLTDKAEKNIGLAMAPYASKILALVPSVKNNLKNKILLRDHNLHELIANCDKIFVIAGWFKKILFENGFTDEKIYKIPNKPKLGISPESKSTNETIKKKILFIGRIEEQKGFHLLCNAMNEIEEDNLELEVYGNKVDENYFEDCKRIYSFNYMGTLPREVLLERIKNYDFLVLPSVCPEMYPLVVVDAIHRELPVIASASKGNRDLVKDNENGFLFEYDNAVELAKTIDKAYRLKAEGWTMQLDFTENPEHDLEEIVSYYKS